MIQIYTITGVQQDSWSKFPGFTVHSLITPSNNCEGGKSFKKLQIVN